MNYKNPIYTEAGSIDCEIEHPDYGWIPFTASPDDCEAHGRELFAHIEANGAIKPYVPPTPPPPPTPEELAAQARAQRDSLLASTDWTQLPDVPQATREAYAVYRQALRDVTLQDGFPTNIIWPTLGD
jgi:hypothetical protein